MTSVIPLVDEGLGNSSYLVDLGDGRALAIDPSRDLRQLDRATARHGVAVTITAETHLHADFVSGSTRLAARDGATVLGSAAGRREFPHVGLAEGDEVDLGGLTLQAWTTPGHTAEHLAYLLRDGERVRAVFSGGSLIVGAAARTDLVSDEHTDALTRAQFRSLRRLTELPDDTPVYPTHGAGSFCSAPPGAERVTTIGREKAANPLLRIDAEDEFVATLLGGLGSYPSYFRRLAEVNRRGPVPADDGALAPLSVAAVLALHASGADLVDVRAPADYAAGHIPGSLAIPLRPAFATWVGWVVPEPSRPLVFVRDADQDPEEIAWQARKVGYDALAGQLDGGVDAWRAAGQPIAHTHIADVADVDPGLLLDVRQVSEYAAGHVPHVPNIELGALASADVPNGRNIVICGHGERATTAASLLERAGRTGVGIVLGGPDSWAHATGQQLEATR